MNFDDPRDLGLLQFGLGMLQASGPRPYRQTFGAGLAEGAQQGLNAYQKQKLLLDELKSRELQRKMTELKTRALEDELAAPGALAKFYSDDANVFKNVTRPAEGDPYGEFVATDKVPLERQEQLRRMMLSGNRVLQGIAGKAMAKDITGDGKDKDSALIRNASFIMEKYAAEGKKIDWPTAIKMAQSSITAGGFQWVPTGEKNPDGTPIMVPVVPATQAGMAHGTVRGYGQAAEQDAINQLKPVEGSTVDSQGRTVPTFTTGAQVLPGLQYRPFTGPYLPPDGAKFPAPQGPSQSPMPSPAGQPSPTTDQARALVTGSGLPGAEAQYPDESIRGRGPILPKDAAGPDLAAKQEKLVQREKYDADMRRALPKARASIKVVEYNADQMIAQIDELKKHPGVPLITGIPSNLRLTNFAKGTLANDAAAKLDVLLNKIVVETIKELKSLSATGSTAFGQLSDREGNRLEQNRTALKEGMTTEGFLSGLDELKKIVSDTKALSRDAYNYEFGKYERERAAESPVDDSTREKLNEMRKGRGLPPL